MVGLAEALLQVKKQTKKMKRIIVSIEDALDFVLAKDVVSSISFPPFPQSAMDGYAINSDNSTDIFKIVGEIKAGDNAQNSILNPGEAIRIFTGAMVPKNSTCVVRQEDVFLFENKMKVIVMPKSGVNIRLIGEQIKEGDIAIKKGTVLNPGSIGYLAMLGVTSVEVYSKPSITIITTGNELTKIGKQLEAGKIYESNSITLLSALKKYGFNAKSVTIHDSYDGIKSVFTKEIKDCDIVIFTGGISVGDYDFVGKVMENSGVKTHFYKVKQKPGKPLFFGDLNGKIIFGLPGNPAAVLTSFYLFILPCLARMTGRDKGFIFSKKVVLKESYFKSNGITHLLKGYTQSDKVDLLPAQSSAMLSSFVTANCIVLFDEDRQKWEVGDSVEILII